MAHTLFASSTFISLPDTGVSHGQCGDVPASAAQNWYGVVIAPNGLNLYSDAGTQTWLGTLLVCKQLNLAAGLTLQLAPDDGAGVGGTAMSSGTVYTAFVPQFNTTIPIGQPVPLVVPRMAWIFE